MPNHWTSLSIDYANQRSYLDDLYRVYPIIPNGIREVDERLMSRIETYYNNRDNKDLIRALLQLDLFPIKDSYVPYLRRDPAAIDRNPQTVNRICGRLYELGFQQVYENCTEPKETNRQIGPMFRTWLNSGALGIQPVDENTFVHSTGDAILDGTDANLKDFANKFFNYQRQKGLDFVGRFNGKYVIGEAKFISDQGGHQNAQFNDAMDTLLSDVQDEVLKIAIIDGVPYISNRGKLHQTLLSSDKPIMSALVLREYLYSI